MCLLNHFLLCSTVTATFHRDRDSELALTESFALSFEDFTVSFFWAQIG